MTAPASRGDSPFRLNQVIDLDDDFHGRHAQRRALMDKVHSGHSVEILGERRVGKSSLMRWLERHLADRKGWSKVRLDGQHLAGRSQGALVAAVAQELGRPISGDLDAPGAAERALEALCPLVLLIDEAEELAVEGHGFTRDFFSFCRSLCQDSRLVWVSASSQEMGRLFTLRGLSSAFLNDSEKVWVGALEAEAAAALLAPVGAEWAKRAMAWTGGWAWGLQWVGERVWRGETDPEELADGLALAAKAHFERWWACRSAREQEVLRQALEDKRWSEISRAMRRELVARGLLRKSKVGGLAKVNGALWMEFVADVS